MKSLHLLLWFLVIFFSITKGDPVGIILGVFGAMFMETMIDELE